MVKCEINNCDRKARYNFKLERSPCRCSMKRRIDSYKIIGNTILAIETDEFQHRKYPTDYNEIRYNDIYMVNSYNYIWIRFNPDSYIDSDRIRKNSPLESRLDVLKDVIKESIF